MNVLRERPIRKLFAPVILILTLALLAACTTPVPGAGSSAGDLTGVTWLWSFERSGEEESRVSRSSNYRLTFNEDGTYAVQADCNSGGGAYTVNPMTGQLTLEPGPMTLAECGELSQANQFMAQLGQVTGYEIEEDKLILDAPDENEQMVFVDAETAEVRLLDVGQCTVTLAQESPAYRTIGLDAEPSSVIVAGDYAATSVTETGGGVWYQVITNDDDSTFVSQEDVTATTGDCAPFPAANLPGQAWLWSALTGVEPAAQSVVPNPESYQLQFVGAGLSGDGTFTYQADCNSGSGDYATERLTSSITLSMGPTTLAECGPDSLANQFSALLADAEQFGFDQGNLILTTSAGAQMQFVRSGQPIEVPPTATPAPTTPTATVISGSAVNVRSGPGTDYPTVASLPSGASAPVLGRNLAGTWWAISSAPAPGGVGWVFGELVEVANAEAVPVLEVDPPIVATPVTPTPTPSPTINFSADRTSINQGECTTLRWQVANVRAVYVYPQGADYTDYPTTGDASSEVCPETTTTYELRVEKTDGSVETRQVTVEVVPFNPLSNTAWSVAAIEVNGVPLPDTSLTILFAGDGNANVNGGCNTFNGPYSVGKESITIGPLVGTQQSCGEDINAQEQTYLRALQSATSYERNGDQLILRNSAGEEVVRFNRAG